MIESDQVLLLEVVRESAGRWDTRSIDFEFHKRGGSHDPASNVLDRLKALERVGHVARVEIVGGTGPGWTVTRSGALLLEETASER